MECVRNSYDDCKKEFVERLGINIEKFLKENGRYPLSVDFDSCEYLLSSKTIQRRVGGVSKLREMLGLEITDYTKGEYRANKARILNKRAEETQDEMYGILIKRFGKLFVHRESPYGDNSKERSDFEIHHKKGSFYVDIFHPGSQKNFFSCLNYKIKKYDRPDVWKNVVFVNTNNEVGCDVSSKKIPLTKKQKVMNIEDFEKYILEFKPIEIKK